MKKQKAIFFLCMVLLLSSIMPMSAFAETRQVNSVQENSVERNSMLRWVNTAVVSVELSIVNGKANCAAIIIGNTGAESITGTAVLVRVNANGTTTPIHSWSNMRVNGNVWMWEAFQYVAKGHDYRLTITATVVRNGVSETVSVSKTARAN